MPQNDLNVLVNGADFLLIAWKWELRLNIFRLVVEEKKEINKINEMWLPPHMLPELWFDLRKLIKWGGKTQSLRFECVYCAQRTKSHRIDDEQIHSIPLFG